MKKRLGKKQKRTKLAKLDEMKRVFFTGRADEIRLFKSLLPLESKGSDILVIYGIGGIGKTELANEFKWICREEGIPVAKIDGRDQRSVISILAELRQQLDEYIEFRSFDRGLKRYLEIQGKLIKQGDIPERVISMLSKGIVLGASITPASAVAEAIGEGTIKMAISTIYKTLMRQEAEFYLNPEDELTQMLLDDLNDYASEKRLVVIFDAYEMMDALNTWVRDEFIAGVGEYALIIIVGRNRLRGTGWEKYNLIMRQIELKCFSNEDAREYLKRKGIIDERTIHEIIDIGDGHPLALALLSDLVARLHVTPLSKVPNHRNVIDELIKRIVSNVVSSDLRLALEACAILRYFNEDSLGYILKLDDVTDIFSKIRGFSFVKQHSKGLALHDAVRESLLEDLQWRSPARYEVLNKRAGQFYEEQLEWASAEEWKQITLERVYHQLKVDERGVINSLESILWDPRMRRVDRDVLLSEVKRHHFKQEVNKQWVNFFVGEVARYSGNMQYAEDLYREILSDPKHYNTELQCRVLTSYGWIYSRKCRDYAKAMGCYKQAYEITQRNNKLRKTTSARLLHYIGRTYEFQGQVEKALEYLNKSIAVGRKFNDMWSVANSLHVIGNIYLLFRIDLGKALQYYKRSIDNYTKINDEWNIGTTHLRIGRVYLLLGELTKGFEYINRGLEMLRDLDPDDARGIGWALRDLAIYYALKGETDRADMYLRESREKFSTLDVEGNRYLLEAIADMCEVLYRQGLFDEVRKYIEEAEQLAKKRENRCYLARVQRIQGHLLFDNMVGLLGREKQVDTQKAVLVKYTDSLSNALRCNRYLLDETVDNIGQKAARLAQEGYGEVAKVIINALIRYWETETLDGKPLVEAEIENRELEVGNGKPQTMVLEKLSSLLRSLS